MPSIFLKDGLNSESGKERVHVIYDSLLTDTLMLVRHWCKEISELVVRHNEEFTAVKAEVLMTIDEKVALATKAALAQKDLEIIQKEAKLQQKEAELKAEATAAVKAAAEAKAHAELLQSEMEKLRAALKKQ